ncbi:MAG: AhpC/TSA family protein [Sphingobacteriia bacterium]|nr:AhpC/TSA family protein [Sphingobacteriia bacterium]
MRYFLMFFLLPAVGMTQEKVEIGVRLDGVPDNIIYFLRDDNGVFVDSSITKNQQLHFKYKGQVTQPVSLILANRSRSDVYAIWLDNQMPVNLWGQFNKRIPLEARGSQLQNDYKEYMNHVQPLDDSARKLRNMIPGLRNTSKAAADSLDAAVLILKKTLTDKQFAFISNHSKSMWSAFVIRMEAAKKNFTKEQAAFAFRQLHTDIQNSSWGSDVVNILQAQQKLVLGEQAPVFTAVDNRGKEIKLSDYKGKNILLIFWASWCGPCRAEIPSIRKAYQQASKEDFTFLSVSVDEKQEDWKAADRKEKLEWTSAWHPGGWMSSPAIAYGVTGIPRIFLIDKEGKLVENDPNLVKIISK